MPVTFFKCYWVGDHSAWKWNYYFIYVKLCLVLNLQNAAFCFCVSLLCIWNEVIFMCKERDVCLCVIKCYFTVLMTSAVMRVSCDDSELKTCLLLASMMLLSSMLTTRHWISLENLDFLMMLFWTADGSKTDFHFILCC